MREEKGQGREEMKGTVRKGGKEWKRESEEGREEMEGEDGLEIVLGRAWDNEVTLITTRTRH